MTIPNIRMGLTLMILFLIFSINSAAADIPGPIITNAIRKVWSVSSTTSPPNEVRLGDSIILEGSNLTELINESRIKQKQLVLFLEGIEVPGLVIESVETNRITLRLTRSAENKSVWGTLLRRPFHEKGTPPTVRKVSSSIGLAKGEPIESNAFLRLAVFKWEWWVVFWATLLIVAAILFFALAKNSDLIRDAGPQPSHGRLAFSLARVQIAFWFFLVIFSFIFIWVVTGEMDSITGSVLALIGISTVTYFTAVTTDKANGSANSKPSLGFWDDILSEENGVTFHRFQIVVWTVVLGLMFLISVCNELSMPEFSGTLLGLMGISSGTYLGFKFKN